MGRTGRLAAVAYIGMLTLAVAWPGTAPGATGDRFAAAVGEFEGFWPAVEGYVVSVTAEAVFTDLPTSAGLRPGSEVTLLREGGDIVHPLTKQVLGRYESPLGVLRVGQVRGGYAVGEFVPLAEGVELKPGDRARITSSKIRLLVVPPAGSVGAAPPEWENELFYVLERSPRLQPRELREGILLREPAALAELARKEGVDAVLTIEPLGAGAEAFVALSLHSGATGSLQATIRVPVGSPFVGPSAAVPAAPGSAPAAGAATAAGSTSWGIFELDRQVVALAMGNLTGGGGGEVAVSDGQGVRVYAPAGAGWKLLWEDEGRPLYRVLALDCGDIDGNGLDELFVTRIAIGRLDSLVLEYQGGGFAVRDDGKNVFYRVVRSGKGPPRLFGQEFGADDVEGRPVRDYAWGQGGYSARGDRLPGLGSVYGFGLADVDGDGTPETVKLDRSDSLQVFTSSGKLLWQSDERFGGSANFIDRDTLGQSLPQKEVGGYLIKGRILAADLDGDGREEVLAPRNVPKFGSLIGGVRAFDRSSLAVLRWDGLAMREAAVPDDLPGYLADFAAAPVPGGVAVVVGLTRRGGVFSRGEGKLLWRTLTSAPVP